MQRIRAILDKQRGNSEVIHKCVVVIHKPFYNIDTVLSVVYWLLLTKWFKQQTDAKSVVNVFSMNVVRRVVLKRHFNGVVNVTSAGTTDDKTFYKPAKHITGCTIRHLTS